jgi:hypothetical protein
LSTIHVIVNVPRLRRALIDEAGRSARSADKSRASAQRVRARVAHALHMLAVCIEPRVTLGNEVGASRPVFVD